MRPEIIIVGAGGHAKVVVDAILETGELEIRGLIDKDQKKKSVREIPVLGDDTLLPELFEQGVRYAFVAVGSIGNTEVREKIYQSLKKIGYELPVIVHPAAYVADNVISGEGTFVSAGAVVNPGTTLGKNVIVNTRSSIDHDCVLGDFVHVAPGAVLGGDVTLGDRTHVGMGAVVIQGANLKAGTFIKAGQVTR